MAQVFQYKCEFCGTDLENHWLSQHICQKCKKPQHFHLPDYFQIFGLEVRFQLNQDELRERFYQLAQLLHPDRFPRFDAQALEKMSFINRAYEVLKNSEKRRNYILQQENLSIEKSHLPLELAEEWFTLQEKIHTSQVNAFSQICQFENQLESQETQLEAQIDQLEQKFDEMHQRDDLVLLAQMVQKKKSLTSLMQDLKQVKHHV